MPWKRRSLWRKNSSGQTKLRLFRVPALNFEAQWVSHEGGEKDLLLPLTEVGRLSIGSVYGYEEPIIPSATRHPVRWRIWTTQRALRGRGIRAPPSRHLGRYRNVM